MTLLTPSEVAQQILRWGFEVVLTANGYPPKTSDLMSPQTLGRYLMRYGIEAIAEGPKPKPKPKFEPVGMSEGVVRLAGFDIEPPSGKGVRWVFPTKQEIRRKARILGMPQEEIMQILPEGVKPTNEDKLAVLKKLDRLAKKRANRTTNSRSRKG